MSEDEAISVEPSVRDINIAAIVEKYQAVAAAEKGLLDDKNRRLRALQKQIEDVSRGADAAMTDLAAEWDRYMETKALPAEDGVIVPWTKSRNGDELIMALDADDWLVVHGATVHLYRFDERSGRWRCVYCRHSAVFEHANIAVKPHDFPSEIASKT